MDMGLVQSGMLEVSEEIRGRKLKVLGRGCGCSIAGPDCHRRLVEHGEALMKKLRVRAWSRDEKEAEGMAERYGEERLSHALSQAGIETYTEIDARRLRVKDGPSSIGDRGPLMWHERVGDLFEPARCSCRKWSSPRGDEKAVFFRA